MSLRPGMTEMLVLFMLFKPAFEINNKPPLKHKFVYTCVMQAVTHMHICTHFYELKSNKSL